MSPIKSEEIDLEQIRKAKDFLDGFNEGGEHPGLLIPYKPKIRTIVTQKSCCLLQNHHIL